MRVFWSLVHLIFNLFCMFLSHALLLYLSGHSAAPLHQPIFFLVCFQIWRERNTSNSWGITVFKVI